MQMGFEHLGAEYGAYELDAPGGIKLGGVKKGGNRLGYGDGWSTAPFVTRLVVTAE